MLPLLSATEHPVDARGLVSAEGWIELGLFDDAAEELHRVPPQLKSTIEFCILWVRIYAATNAWANVECMCETLTKHAPEDSFTIRFQAEAFHRQGRSREAFAVYQMAPIRFKDGVEYFYDMCRFLCAIGDLPLARIVLARAVKLDRGISKRALDDPELEPMWVELQRSAIYRNPDPSEP